MIIVIQCAANKIPGAGHLISGSGERVVFVADPQAAPAKVGTEYARPDDPSGSGLTWRESLQQYNSHNVCANPHGLTPAAKLYKNGVYRRLVDRFASEKVFILSAGWGIIRSDFLTPYYDITFSPEARGANSYKRRRASDLYRDFPFPEDAQEDIVFFGGKDYLKLFIALTGMASGRRTVYYNSKPAPSMPGCVFERFQTKAKTNWHYLCANTFLDRGTEVLCPPMLDHIAQQPGR